MANTMTVIAQQILLLSLFALSLAFDLEGSQTSYAKFPRWQPCQNGSISLEFRTSRPDGLILYSDDGGKYDFLELKLVKGMIRLRLNLGGGAIILTVGQNLHDMNWHKLELHRRGEDTILELDNIEHFKSSPGSEYAFGNITQNSFVFIGGMPIAYSAKLSLLALPSVMFEPRFRGSIRNLLYRNCGGPEERFEMIASQGVRTNNRDECEVDNPCVNGGVCISTDTGSICDCTNTDYEGPHCETEKIPSEATFYGAHYLSYDLSPHGDPIISSSDQVILYFKTRQPNGLIFYTGDGLDFMNLALREGGVILTMNLGSGIFETEVKPRKGSVRFDDNLWHKLAVEREARELIRNRGICHVTVQVDDTYKRTGTIVGDFTMLSSNELYLGGSPNTAILPGSKVKDNFRGCLRKVIYIADSISLDLTDLARNSHDLIDVHGDVLFNKCEDLVQSQPITFLTEESFIRAPSWHAPNSGTVEFQLRTVEFNGLLMYHSGVKSVSDVFALEIIDGFLYLLLDLGAGGIKVCASHRMISDGLPHTVSIHHERGIGSIIVDGQTQEFTVPGTDEELDLEGPLYIGGMNHKHSLLSVTTSLWSASLRHGYVGCLQDLVINGEKVDVAELARNQKVEGVKEFCRVVEPMCDSQPCMHRGKCREGWNRFVCDCSMTAYTGPSCNGVASVVSFDGTQHVRIELPEESRTEAEDITLRFQSSRANGLLFATSSTSAADHLELMLDNGRIRLDIDLGSGVKTLYAGQSLNDEGWHNVHIRRRAKKLQLSLDGEQAPKDELLESERTLLHFDTLHVGALPKHHPSYHETLEGPSKLVELDNLHLGGSPQGDDPRARQGGSPRDNFKGNMQHFVFNKKDYLEMVRSGALQNVDTSATFEKKEHSVNYPITFKTTHAYITARLRIYSTFNIYFQVKTTQPDGLIMYCGGGRGKDFFVVELFRGHVRYIFDTGSGARVLRSTLEVPINDNKWHSIGILRPSLQKTVLRVDESAAINNLPDRRSVHFDTDDMVYIGGVEQSTFDERLPKQVKSREGFQGCLASIDLDGDTRNILEYRAEIPDQHRASVLEGCKGPASECTTSSCENGGICIQEWNSFRCDCDMTSFTGTRCADDSIAYSFGSVGGLVTFEYPENQRPDTRQDQLVLGFSTTQKDAILVRVNSGISSDYIEMEIVDGHIFVVYNMGTMDHPIGELFEKVNDGEYHVVRFTRMGPNSTIQVDNKNMQTKNPKGQQLIVFNDQARVHIGGKKDGKNKLTRPFQGTIAGFVLNGLRVLDLAAEGDPRVTIEGDVVLEMAPLRPHSGVTSIPPYHPQLGTPSSGETTTPGDGMTDDIIYSGGGSGCSTDDEDDCSRSGSGGDKDAFVKPIIKITTTPRPPTTTVVTSTPQSTTSEPRPINQWGSGENPCVDDEDCDEGSGRWPVEAKPVYTPKTTTDDIYLNSPEPAKQPVYPEERNPNEIYPPDEGHPYPRQPNTPNPLLVTENMTETHTRRGGVAITTRRTGIYGTDPPEGVVQGGINTGGITSSEDPKKSGIGPLGLHIGLIVGIAAAVFLLLIILAYALYKYKSRDEGSYKIDETRNYPYDSPIPKPSPSVNGGHSKPGMHGPPPGGKPGKKKDVKEWYV